VLEIEASNIECSRSARDHPPRPELERESSVDGRRQQTGLDVADQPDVVFSDSQMKFRIVPVPRNVPYPALSGVHTSARHDSLEVLQTSPAQQQSNVEIELLRAWEAFIEPADLEEESPSVERSFDVDVVFDEMSQGFFARPIGMGGRGDDALETMITELEVSKYRIHTFIEDPEPSFDGIRDEHIVRVEKLNELAACRSKSVVAGCRCSLLPLRDTLDITPKAFDDLETSVARSVIDDYDLDVSAGLAERTVDRVTDEILVVVARYDDRDPPRNLGDLE
jgi:hypothetical protein